MANNITSMLGAANYAYLFNNNTQRQNSINSLWQNYGSFQSNATNNLAALQEIRQNRAAVIDSYNEAKDTFYAEFDSNMSALKKSAANIKNFDFSSVNAAATKTATDETSTATTTTAATTATATTANTTAATTSTNSNATATNPPISSTATTSTTTTKAAATVEQPITKTAVLDKDGNEVKDKYGKTVMKTTYSKAMQGALDTVKDLVNNYNESLSFLQDNSAVSGRVGRMASNFGDTTYRSSLYESIGINVGKDGSLSIDEEKLANSIVNDPDKVSRILGKDGLAGKAEQHVNTANGQRSNLFPSAKSMLGSQLDQAAIYTGKSMVNMSMISNIGNLINMMF